MPTVEKNTVNVVTTLRVLTLILFYAVGDDVTYHKSVILPRTDKAHTLLQNPALTWHFLISFLYAQASYDLFQYLILQAILLLFPSRMYLDFLVCVQRKLQP